MIKFSEQEQAVLDEALSILRNHINNNDVFTSPETTKKYLCIKMAGIEREQFNVLFLDNQNRLIDDVTMFEGTIDACSVYPRVIVQKALELNASSMIIYHQHPSGNPEPSQADRRITRRLSDALNLVDIRVLDHFVVGGDSVVSFAERGWI